jgi:hypothetical protein
MRPAASGLAGGHFLPMHPLPPARAQQPVARRHAGRRDTVAREPAGAVEELGQRLLSAADLAHALRRATEDPGCTPAASSHSHTPAWPPATAQATAVSVPDA